MVLPKRMAYNYNNDYYYDNNQASEFHIQCPFRNQENINRQGCRCNNQESNQERRHLVSKQQQNLNSRNGYACSCKENNMDENYRTIPCPYRSNNQEYQYNGGYKNQQATFEQQHYLQQPAVEPVYPNQCICSHNECENVEFQTQPSQGEMQIRCPCKTCRKKVHAKFGLAWIVQGPGYENFEEPTGWQMEFIDTPSCVFQKCQDMIQWVNSPPVQTSNCITESNRPKVGQIGYSGPNPNQARNNPPHYIRDRYPDERGAYETRKLDVEEQPVKDIQSNANRSTGIKKSSSKELVVTPTSKQVRSTVTGSSKLEDKGNQTLVKKTSKTSITEEKPPIKDVSHEIEAKAETSADRTSEKSEDRNGKHFSAKRKPKAKDDV